MNLNKLIQEKLEIGKLYEDLFVSLVDGKWIRATPYQDMNEHWDVMSKKTGAKVDIKGSKSDDYVCLEFKNVNGGTGWMMGEADFIAFWLFDRFYVVDRDELLSWAMEVIPNQPPVGGMKFNDVDFYTPFRREGRRDIIVKIKPFDIMKLARRIVI